LGPDGQVEHYKAHLVAKEFSQVKGIDFNKTYSSVVSYSTVQTLLALACANGRHIHQIDAKSAFLNRNLKEEIYMKIPPGQDRPERHVWQLRNVKFINSRLSFSLFYPLFSFSFHFIFLVFYF